MESVDSGACKVLDQRIVKAIEGMPTVSRPCVRRRADVLLATILQTQIGNGRAITTCLLLRIPAGNT